MNRLILVGNGFDLAHGLETSYKHFIDGFWKIQYELYIKDSQKNVEYKNSFFRLIYNLAYDHQTSEDCEFGKFSKLVLSKGCGFQFFNKFLEKISNKISIQNWVDIENEYYNELKKVSETGYNVDKLNKDFEEVKNLLIDYLNKIDKNYKENAIIIKNINSYFKLRDLESDFKNDIYEQITNYCNDSNKMDKITDFRKSFIDEIIRYNKYSNEFKSNFINQIFDNTDDYYKEILSDFLKPKITSFINFNYTSTTSGYLNHGMNCINIHGELKKKQNPIIFGFGDDVDKKYQEFEDLNDNRYLENFKSIAYLQTDNYKKLLEFIDSEEYQVFIFGHSCGISDRTMLNTIFEHDNCKSIKPFYHKREDGTDNYTEIVQNISRNFNDKKKYRDRVVNKTYCEPLT